MLTKEQMDALPRFVADATQGPWDRDGDSIIECSDHLDICHVVWRDKGNARLIALAPTLAATVIEQQAEIERLRDGLNAVYRNVERWNSLQISSRIRKALGATQ